MAEETTDIEETEVTSEASTTDRPAETAPPPSFEVGGEKYSQEELQEVHKYYGQLEEYAKGLEEFREATNRLMNPETDLGVKKRDAR